MKKTKMALFHSVIALILCVSMLVGTTFAWFTDTVTSGKNQILTGNLDVELEYLNANGKWQSVNEYTNVFEEDTLWEPGHTEVVYLRISNQGSLALQYQLGVNIVSEIGGTNVYGNDFKLSQYIQYGAVENVTAAYATRDLARAAVTESQTLSAGYSKTGSILAGGDPVYVAMVVYMPEEVGNEANYKTGTTAPQIDLGITLTATQYTSEKDSFGSDYDAGAMFPEINLNVSVSAPVETTADNKVAKEVTLTSEDGKISAVVPVDVQLEEGVMELTLSITEIEDSAANITLGENEISRSVDVHISGVAADNTVPMIITIREMMPTGLNMGNYTFYHVENGVTNTMTLTTADALDAHNEYTYDPANGDVSMALASFSEVATVANEENAWNGTIATAFSSGAGTESDPYIIANADQMAYFSQAVSNDNDTYGSAYYKLIADVNFGGETAANAGNVYYPVGWWAPGEGTNAAGETTWYTYGGSFKGTFDGNGHTISNIYQNTWQMDGDYDNGYWNDAMGIFGYVYGGVVKNLTVDNFSSDGEFTPTGIIAAYAAGDATFENIAITNCNPRVYNTGNGGIIGVAGSTSAANDDHITLKNITVDNSNKISALWGSWDVACGGLVGMYRGNVDSNGEATGDTITFTNCHVAAQIDVNNDVCANYQYYAYRYAGMIIGSIRHNTTNENGKTIPDMTGITASGCTVNYGDWNDYYYCELVANTIASYTHDYQFSRLTQVEKVEGTTITYLDGTTGTVPSTGSYNYVVVNKTDDDGNYVHATENAECYHFVNGEVWTHDMSEKEDLDGDGVAETYKEDHAHIHLPFHQLFTGYGWGVNSVGLVAYSGIVTDQDIKEDDQNTSEVKFETKFTNDYLYRVGNLNTVALGSLFQEVTGAVINDAGVYVSVEPVDSDMDVSGTYKVNPSDWTQSTIQFKGTGVVKVTIQDYYYCIPTTLYLEVVDAYNRTTASFSGNSVLLNDVSTTTVISTSGVLYGNGFTINMEKAPISEKNGAVFHLYDGAILKNVKIVGKEFTSVSTNVNDTNYGVSAVRAWGTVVIENCYISGCRAAVSVTGTELTIKDSVIANGVYANVDFRSGVLNLHNVTTINEPHTVDGTIILGLGIVGNMTASAGRKLNITGTLTQYNWVSQADCDNIKTSGVSSIFNSVFTDDEYASLRYTYNGTTYVNTGILSLCEDFRESAVTGTPSDYSGKSVTVTLSGVTINGYVWAPGQAGTLSNADMAYHDTVYEWTPSEQGTSYVAPTFAFSSTDLEVESGVVQISYEVGSSYTLTADTIKALLPAEKYGKSLSYTISMNGEDYTDRSIVFDATSSQTYTITYTILDNLIYNQAGTLTSTTYEVTKDLKVFATVVDKSADAPTFTFYYGTNGSASGGTPHATQPTANYTSTIKQIGDVYYIMPSVTATSDYAIGSETIDGENVYYPIVDGINVRSGNSTDYDFTRYYPIFKAVTISDNGTIEYSYDGTTEMPDTVVWVEATITGNGATALNDGYALYNSQYLCKSQKKAGDTEDGDVSLVKFSYTALDGNTYYYYVGYRFYNEDEGGACVTPDTLATLADGTQKRIDELTFGDKILAWDFFTGTYVEKDIAILVNHGEDLYKIANLQFSDGTVLRIIADHGVFDYDLNKYVYITVDNMQDYIGHRFVQYAADGGYNIVTLTDAYETEEYTSAWSISSAGTGNAFASGLLTVAPPEDFYNWIEMGDKLMYNVEQFQQDVENYGLYTYDDFKDYVTYEQFVAWNGAYLKIAVEKGCFTFDYILELIEMYKGWMPNN